MNERYIPIFEECVAYGFIKEGEVMSWYASGKYEITVVLNDGRKFSYDQLTKTYKRLPTIDEQYKHVLPSERVYREEFASKLRSRISASGMTQKELAAKTGINSGMINKYVIGESLPGLYNLKKLTTALSCSTSELTELY